VVVVWAFLLIFSLLSRVTLFFLLYFLRLVIYFLLVSFSARDSGITSMTYPKRTKITHTTQEGDVFHWFPAILFLYFLVVPELWMMIQPIRVQVAWVSPMITPPHPSLHAFRTRYDPASNLYQPHTRKKKIKNPPKKANTIRLKNQIISGKIIIRWGEDYIRPDHHTHTRECVIVRKDYAEDSWRSIVSSRGRKWTTIASHEQLQSAALFL
jgi:hypothetical protein